MASRASQTVSLKGLETLYRVGSVGHLTDGQLLDWFVSGRGKGEAAEAAFTAMVDRHGPMVLRVCRRILGDTDDAEDAFQATFLVLVRRAGSVRKRDSVASWLHGIARRVSLRARSDRARRRACERRGAEMSARAEARSPAEPESWPELHEEVARLPGPYREAVVLCYLDGLTTEEASRRLGCPQGTILSRLSRARDRLRDRPTRRGLALPAGLFADTLRPAAVPPALSRAAIHSALKLADGAATAIVPTSVAGLTRGVLRTMILTKLGIAAAAVASVAVLAAGAGAFMLRSTDAGPEAARAGGDTPPAPSALAETIGRIRALLTPELVPADLKWTDVGGEQRLQALDLIAARARANYERFRTWTGTYAFRQGQLWQENQLPPPIVGGLPMQNVGKLVQEFDGRMRFAIDMASGDIFRDIRYSAMSFRKAATGEVVRIPNVGVSDTRSIVTRDRYIHFEPDERATYGALAHVPEARDKRMARRAAYDRRQIYSHHGGMMDPRAFFTFDTGNTTWRNLELIADALRGKNGGKTRRMVEGRFRLAQADGPDGRWYCHQQWFGVGNSPSMWATAFWSPRAGLNPVGYVTTMDRPDGNVSTKVEWEWTAIDDIHVPSRIREVGYEDPKGPPSRDRESRLSDAVLNRPLAPHQFDHTGLGLADGDLIIDEVERVGYIIKDGEPVKLADFVEPRSR